MTVQTVARAQGSTARPSSLDNVWVIIPARNEQATISLVLSELPAVGRVIVVDNGSIDRTALVAEMAGGKVVSEPRRGYGSACLRGMQAIVDCIEQGDTPPEAVVFLEAGYRGHGEQLSKLVDPILSGQAEFVLGSRLLGRRNKGAMPWQSVVGHRVACLIMKKMFGAHHTDIGSFRAIRYESLQRLKMVDRGFGWAVEMQIKVARAGLRTRDVPVSYRHPSAVSNISGTVGGTMQAGSKILFTIGKYGWNNRRFHSVPAN
ncbi:MAG: glycosyltransferase family 2 protein [Pirellulales bacterium]